MLLASALLAAALCVCCARACFFFSAGTEGRTISQSVRCLPHRNSLQRTLTGIEHTLEDERSAPLAVTPMLVRSAATAGMPVRPSSTSAAATSPAAAMGRTATLEDSGVMDDADEGGHSDATDSSSRATLAFRLPAGHHLTSTQLSAQFDVCERDGMTQMKKNQLRSDSAGAQGMERNERRRLASSRSPAHARSALLLCSLQLVVSERTGQRQRAAGGQAALPSPSIAHTVANGG